MQNTKPLVLYFGLDKPQESLLLQILAGQQLTGRRIKPGDRLRPIGELTESVPFASEPGTPETPESTESIIIMDSLSDGQINSLLASIRQTDGLTITLKAVVTANNRSWPFVKLAEELRQEHAVMQAYTALTQLSRRAQAWLDDHPDEINATAALTSALQQARIIERAFHGEGELDGRALKAAIRELATQLETLA